MRVDANAAAVFPHFECTELFESLNDDLSAMFCPKADIVGGNVAGKELRLVFDVGFANVLFRLPRQRSPKMNVVGNQSSVVRKRSGVVRTM